MERHRFWICFIIYQFLSVKATQSLTCSSNKRCECSRIKDNKLKADCSRRQLSEIPRFDLSVVDIDLSGNENLSKIPAINYLPSRLIRLDATLCNLQHIELGALQGLKNLYYLDISWNPELTLDVLSNITNDLIGSNIKTLKFNAIQCSEGAGKTLKFEHLCRLQNSSLQEIELAKNRIDMIEQHVLRSLPSSLKDISAGINRLRFGSYMLEISSLENLRFLNLSDMYAMNNPFEHPWSVKCMDKKTETSVGTSRMLMPCSKSNIDENESEQLPDSKVIMYMPSKLETLVMNNCIIRVTKKLNKLVLKYPSLKRVFANNNFLRYLNGYDHSLRLEEAYLSNSFIVETDDLFFRTSNLTILDLSYNLLGEHFTKQRSAEQLQSQKFLRILNLSYNRLHYSPFDLFKGLTKLEVLNVSGTELKKLHFTFSSLINLKTFDLSDNRIRTLSDSNMREFDDLSTKTLLFINLTGNDIICTCETLTSLKWMQNKQNKDSQINFTNFEEYTCSFINSTQKSFRHISEIIMDLEKTCSTKSIIFIISGILILLFIIIVISGILYRYRWKLRYIYHMTRRSLRGYFLLQNDDGSERKCFEFDVFISYADEDNNFAYTTLKSKVQSKNPAAKLCYHKEQFIPGSDVAENIVNAVNCSRKTVCVLSEYFLASEWCIYEFKMANLEKIYKRGDQNSLIILMLGSINTESVPVDIMTYLNSRSYLEVPSNIDEFDVYWDHIISVIIDE